MKIDIWSDIVCPFCVIGKRHLELSLDGFEHRDDVELVWHSYELDPTIAAEPTETLVETIAHKYGISAAQSEASQKEVEARAAAVGLTFNWREAKYGNTFNAHRLVHLAANRGLGTEATKHLMNAYFTEGASIGNVEVLQQLGEEIGLPAEDVHRVLAGDGYADAVRRDEAMAGERGISGVPFFVLNDEYGISGAQPVEVFEQALNQAWNERSGLQMVSATGEAGADANGPSCEGDQCSI